MTDAENLCVECGMCCNGALFDYGPLPREEVQDARDAGLKVLEADEKYGFALPCPQLNGAVCQVYERRPKTCCTFRCETLKAVEAGAIPHAEGLARIEQAHAALENVRSHLPEGANLTDARRWRRNAHDADAAANLNASPMLMITLGMLDIVLDQYFRKPGDRQVMPRE